MADVKLEDLYSKGRNSLQMQVQINSDEIEKLKLDVRNASSEPVLSAAWIQLRSAMRTGYVAADGQLLKRVDYPAAWEAIQAGLVPVVSDAEWTTIPSKRGAFTAGNGSTTFRVPDYNGKTGGSLGAAMMRGDGLNSAGTNGTIQGDAIRNITGTFGQGSQGGPFHNQGHAAPTGVFDANAPQGTFRGMFEAGTVGSGISFDASKVVPTAADNHPVNVTGCWAVKLFGYVQNAGDIDAKKLATQLAEAQSEIAKMKQVVTTTIPLQGNPNAGSLVLVKKGSIVAFRAISNVPSAWVDGTSLFDIPIGFRPHDVCVSSEFMSNIGKTDGDNGRLILRKDKLESWRLFGSSVYFRTSGTWIAED